MFFGTSSFAVPSLERIAASRHDVIVCVTQPDRPQGRGRVVEPSPVKQAALRLGLPLAQPARPRADEFQTLRVDIGVVVAYGQLIRPDLLALPPHGMLGVHPSLLPRYRGAAPVAHAILNGETETGVAVFRLSKELDAGDLLSVRRVGIEATENAEMLTHRLACIGAEDVVVGLDALAAGEATFTPQDASRATLAPKLYKSMGRIDWGQEADAIVRLVRATIPWPGASTAWRGRAVKVWAAASASEQPGVNPRAPGTVLRADAGGVVVAAGRGAVVVQELQPEGRRRMSVQEFLAGHPVQVGDIFGGTREP